MSVGNAEKNKRFYLNFSDAVVRIFMSGSSVAGSTIKIVLEGI